VTRLVDAVGDAIERCLNRDLDRLTDGVRVLDPGRLQALRRDVEGFAVAAVVAVGFAPDADRTSARALARRLPSFGLGEFVPPSDFLDRHGADLDPCVRELGPDADPAALVEGLLGVEFRLSDGRFVRARGKADRNRQGAYYTPAHLARACTTSAVDRLIEQRLGIVAFSRSPDADRRRHAPAVAKLLRSATVADLSSGTGRFLAAWIHYLRSRVGPLLADGGQSLVAGALEGVVAVDIDPLALLAARARLAPEGAGFETFAALAPRFVHANPLAIGPEPLDADARRAIWRAGQTTDVRLGLGPGAAIPDDFDLILGNPPWERIRLEERAFFSRLDPSVAARTQKAERRRAIDATRAVAPVLHGWFLDAAASVDAYRDAIRRDPRLAAASAGELNTYTLFTALALAHLADDGVAGLLVKTAICTTPAHRGLFRSLLGDGRIVAIHDFINTEKIFPIDSRERFCWVVAGAGEPGRLTFRAGLTRTEQLATDEGLVALDEAVLDVLNPLTGMVPSIERGEQLQLLLDLAADNAAFDAEWSPRFGRIVHLTAHAAHLHRAPGADRLAVWEGKFLGPCDGRARTFEGVPEERRYVGKAKAKEVADARKADPEFLPVVRWFLEADAWEKLTRRYQEPWSLVWRNTTSASNTTPCIATLLPHLPTIQSVQLLQLDGSPPRDLAVLLAILGSAVVEGVLRLKLNGIDLTSKVVRQLPVPPAARWASRVSFAGRTAELGDHVARRVASLLVDDARLRPFAAALGVHEAPPRADRPRIRRELDVLVASAYALDPAGLARLFRIVPPARTAEEVSSLTNPARWPTAAD